MNMNKKGYTNFTSDFLVKNVNNISINISRNNAEVTAITGYDNEQNIVNIPSDIQNQVISDITDSNK